MRIAAHIRLFLFLTFLPGLALPVCLHAQGINLLADYEYFFTKLDTVEKDTGIETDSEFTRFTQLYQLDIGSYIFPNLLFNVGGYFEQDDTESTEIESFGPEFSSENTEKTMRPYIELNLINPLYSGGLAYRKRETETSGDFRTDETLNVDEYDFIFNWRPVDLPLVNFNYRLIELEDDPLTLDTTRESINLGSKYTYGDYYFHYLYNSLESFDNLKESGNLNRNHNIGVRYSRGFDYKGNRFDLKAGVKYIYNTIDFLGANAAAATVDTPADFPGTPFYILNDASPSSNQDVELVRVEGGNQLTEVNIGRNGGFNPVSAGLSFESPTEVETVYIRLSRDLESFPNLASPSQVASLSSSFFWRVYASDDLADPNWTEQPLSEATYNSVDNRFEIRIDGSVRARLIKITTTPLDLAAPGEIRYTDIDAYTTIEGGAREPEVFEQHYTYGLQWTPNSRTVIGYDGHYINEDARHDDSGRTSMTNLLYFRHRLSDIFNTDGRVSRNDRTRTTQDGEEEEIAHLLSLSLRANYLDTLSQILTYSGTNTEEPDGTSTTNSLILRTIADLYPGWSTNLDLGYGINSLVTGDDQTVTRVKVGTIVEPNRNINLSMDYSISWTDQTGQEKRQREYGTFQLLWALTGNLNAFFRYSFRNQDIGASSDLREFNINWTPFAGGALQLSLGYNESSEFGDREIKTFTPTLSWEVARGVFLDLRYTTGTIESPEESSDLESIIGKLRFFY